MVRAAAHQVSDVLLGVEPRLPTVQAGRMTPRASDSPRQVARECTEWRESVYRVARECTDCTEWRRVAPSGARDREIPTHRARPSRCQARTARALHSVTFRYRLIRLVRASRIAKRFETQMAINYGTLALYRSGINVLLLAHWLGCVWGLQAIRCHCT